MLRSIFSVMLGTMLVACLSTLSTAASFEGRTGVGLQMGLHSVASDAGATVGVGGVHTTYDNSGFLGGISVEHWVDPRWSIKVAVSAMAIEASSSVSPLMVETRSATVTSVLFSAQYQFLATSPDSPWRPYLTFGVGPYVGSESSSQVGTIVVAESHTEQAVGGFAGIGVDVLLGRRFLLGTLAGFHGMSDFSDPIDGRKNYSAAAFSLNFSYLFGGK